MERLFEELIEAAKKNRKGFNRLKNAVVTCQQFELASQLRDIEKEAFPETEEVKLAKEQAKKLNLAFRMVELNISEDVCWLIEETLKMHNEKQGEFSIDDAVKLRCKKEELFFNRLAVRWEFLKQLPITCKYKQFYQMTTITKTITYNFIWQLDSAENYKFTKCKKLFNTKTMREIKKTQLLD